MTFIPWGKIRRRISEQRVPFGIKGENMVEYPAYNHHPSFWRFGKLATWSSDQHDRSIDRDRRQYFCGKICNGKVDLPRVTKATLGVRSDNAFTRVSAERRTFAQCPHCFIWSRFRMASPFPDCTVHVCISRDCSNSIIIWLPRRSKWTWKWLIIELIIQTL